jgi:hypothetical protein
MVVVLVHSMVVDQNMN